MFASRVHQDCAKRLQATTSCEIRMRNKDLLLLVHLVKHNEHLRSHLLKALPKVRRTGSELIWMPSQTLTLDIKIPHHTKAGADIALARSQGPGGTRSIAIQLAAAQSWRHGKLCDLGVVFEAVVSVFPPAVDSLLGRKPGRLWGVVLGARRYGAIGTAVVVSCSMALLGARC